MGIITSNGQKLTINYTECITNEDESVVFQIIFIAIPHPNDCVIIVLQIQTNIFFFIRNISMSWRQMVYGLGRKNSSLSSSRIKSIFISPILSFSISTLIFCSNHFSTNFYLYLVFPLFSATLHPFYSSNTLPLINYFNCSFNYHTPLCLDFSQRISINTDNTSSDEQFSFSYISLSITHFE